MKAIGTDVCIRTCRAEGYTVIFGNRNDKLIDKEKCYRITQSNPEAWPSGYLTPQPYESNIQPYLIDDSKSFTDLLEILDSNYDSVSSFADFDNCPIETENPTIFDFLNLASVLVSYHGNHWFSN